MNRLDIVNTSRYPTHLVNELVRFALSTKVVGHVAVNVKSCSGVFAGRAYPCIPGCSPRKGERLVVLRIGAPERFPWSRTTPYRGMKHAPLYTLDSWQEALVALAAHELTHAQQYALKLPASELEAERSLVQSLVEYRRWLSYTEPKSNFAEVRHGA